MHRRSRSCLVLAFTIVLGVVVAAAGGPTPSSALSVPKYTPTRINNPSADRIVFKSYNAIEQIDPDGSDRRVLIQGGSFSGPDQTADGSRLVLSETTGSRDAAGNLLVWHTLQVTNGDGTGRAPLGGRSVYGRNPRWSPDARRVAFEKTSADGRPATRTVAIVDADGTNETVVGAGAWPDWSPDGGHLVFEANGRVWVVEARAGATAVAITPPPTDAWKASNPRWSPDGTLIGFSAGQNTAVVHPDGSGLRVFGGGSGKSPFVQGWSPGGRHLLQAEYGFHQDANLVWRTDDGVLHYLNQVIEGTWTKPSGESPCPRPYWMLGRDGGVFTFGKAGFFGSTGGMRLREPVVGMAVTPESKGYWLVAGDGGVFTFGDAGFFGSTGALRLKAPIVGVAATRTGRGYWLVASDGGIFTFGDAEFFGSTGALRLKAPIVGMAPTPTGNGYWLVASDGGVFTFGDAEFFGSTGALQLQQPMVSMAPTPAGQGYWLVARDGGVFTFGDAKFPGSAANPGLGSSVVAAAGGPPPDALFLATADGQVAALGDARFCGSARPLALAAPIVGFAAAP